MVLFSGFRFAKGCSLAYYPAAQEANQARFPSHRPEPRVFVTTCRVPAPASPHRVRDRIWYSPKMAKTDK
jgi:hypothetical protein